MDAADSLNMGNLQTMGIVNALKTGDVRIDFLIAMCIPIVIKYAFGMIGNMGEIFDYDVWEAWWMNRGKQYTRSIVYKTKINYYGDVTSLDEDTQNAVLIKAIQLYLHEKNILLHKNALIDLTTMNSSTMSSSSNRYYYDSDEDDDRSGKTMVGMLRKYRIVRKPTQSLWHKVGVHGKSRKLVELKILETEESEGEKKETTNKSTLTYHFVSTGEDSIDDLIEKAHKWYMEQLEKMEDNSRFLYEINSKAGSSDEEDGTGGFSYSRYKLSDEKSFDSLFFEEKESILNWVDHFQNKTGKYAIRGYPHKMGLLLHGPPGTGKTSLIKALAQYTQRSIVNVPLAKITTNTELMSVFFGRKFKISGQNVPVQMGFKDVIFVMEDVDAASRVVRRRDGKQGADVVVEEEIDMPPPKSVWRMILESNNYDCRELVKLLSDKSDRLKAEAANPDILVGISKRMMQLPGLGLVGEDSDALISQIGEEACASATELMGSYDTVDSFMGVHARTIMSLLEAGTEVNDEFVDSLMGAVSNTNLRAAATSQSHKNDVAEVAVSDAVDNMTPVEFTGGVATGVSADGVATATENQPQGQKQGPPTKAQASTMSVFQKKDQLTLSGLLNVLDGVVDTPERILIMTTNHPEILDPALIRPGRIDKKLMLGYMKAPDIVNMLEHYYGGKLSSDQKRRVVSAVAGDSAIGLPALNLTPAQIEQMTAENDELEDMIRTIELKGFGGKPPDLSKIKMVQNVTRSLSNRSTSSVRYEMPFQ